MGRSRLLIFGLIGGLLAGLLVLVAALPQALDRLSTAQSDNTQWTILQVETEVANLAAALAQGEAGEIRLRAEILLSRIDLVQRGQGRALFAANGEAQEILGRLQVFGEEMAALLDGGGALSGLVAITGEMRPEIRRLAVLGLSEGARQGDARRAQLYHQLRLIGTTAILLITSLLVVLLIVQRLLTNLREQERELRGSSDRLAATVAASLDGIIISDAAGRIVGFNASAEAIFGWSAAEILGRTMGETIVPARHRAAHGAGMARYRRTGEAHVIGAGRVELSALRKSGEEFPIELNLTTTAQGDGTLYIAYLRDISERKISEARLIEARDQAERMDRAKTRLLTVMSHEMRTPLNGILGVLDLLRTTGLDDRQSDYVDVATASGEILLEQVNEALDVARLETGDLAISVQAFDLSGLADRLIQVLRPLAREKGLELRLEMDPVMGRVFLSDAARLRQILTNLIGNAIKFSSEGEITVAIGGIHGPERTTARFRVTDQGPGIPADQLDAIFEDFTQLRAPEGRQGRNDGLGLSIARRLAKRLGGTLEVESTVGQGSAFTLTVPLERGTEAAEEDAGAGAGAQETGMKTVLIVEDNGVNRRVLRDMLGKLGHRVREAETGLAALEVAAAERFDLIIMDISMPEMDGIEATRRLRAGGGPNRETCVLGLTAHGREEFRDPALAAGMDRFCTKPIRFPVLREVLETIRAGAGEIDVEVAGDLLAALGADQARAAAGQFFGELDDTLGVLRDLVPGEDDVAISEHLHKLRGGALLLGLAGVVGRIDAVSKAARAGEGYRAGLDTLAARAPEAQTGFGDFLNL
ncbi:MAG: ATP-binding protein [Silicimonas sp.]|nr:ATP-binding protein [Silicimonas sp.]